MVCWNMRGNNTADEFDSERVPTARFSAIPYGLHCSRRDLRRNLSTVIFIPKGIMRRQRFRDTIKQYCRIEKPIGKMTTGHPRSVRSAL